MVSLVSQRRVVPALRGRAELFRLTMEEEGRRIMVVVIEEDWSEGVAKLAAQVEIRDPLRLGYGA
jgi:hypothetical protein